MSSLVGPPSGSTQLRRLAFLTCLLVATAIPVEDVYELPGIGTPARFLGLLLVAFAGLAVLGDRRLRAPSPHVVWAYGFLLWVIASMFWTADPTSSTERIVTYVQLFALLLIVHELCTSQEHVDRLLQGLVAGSFLAALSVGYSFLLGIEAYYGRFAVPGADPNYTAVSLAMVIPVAWYLASRTSTPGWRWFDLGYLVVGTAAVALTGSRAGLLSLGIAFGMVVVLASRGATRRDRLRLLALVGCSAVVVAFVVPEFIVERLSLLGEEIETGDLNGRVQLWGESLDAFAASPVLGTGAGATRVVLPTGKVAHNLVLSIAVEFGLVGLVLFLGTVVSALRGIGLLERGRRTMLLTAVGILAFGSLSLSIESRKLLWLLIALVGAATTLASRGPDRDDGMLDAHEPHAHELHALGRDAVGPAQGSGVARANSPLTAPVASRRASP